MKSAIVTIAIALALVIPASAQWLRTEKKNLITGKTEVTYGLASEPPEKAMLVLRCDDDPKLAIATGFQVPDPGPSEYSYRQGYGFNAHLLGTAVRLDSKIETPKVDVLGGLNNYIQFSRAWTRRILVGEIAESARTQAPKEAVIELPEFAGALHQIVFKMDPPLPVTLADKGKNPTVLCPAESPQTATPATSK